MTSKYEPLLPEEHNLTSAILETVSALVVVLDAEGRIVRFNRMCEQATGYSFEEVRGRCLWDTLLVAEEVDKVKTVFKSLQAGNFPNQAENYWVARDGNLRLIAWSNTAILDERGSVRYIVGTGIDVTERRHSEKALRESEEKYRELVENANSIILRLDTVGNVTFFNEFAQRFFGYDESEIIGKSAIGTIVPPTDSAGNNLVEKIADLVAYPERYAATENENMRRGGERVWVAWTNKAVLDEHGRVAQVLCVGNDITSRKQAEDELRKARDELSALLKLIQAASSSLELAEVLRMVAQGIAGVVGQRGCGIYLVDEESRFLFPAPGTVTNSTRGPAFAQAYHSRPLDPTKDAFTRQVLESREPTVCYDAQTDPRTDKETARLLGLKSILAVPFVAKGRVVAVAMISTFDDYHIFTEEEIAKALGMANTAAVAIENARLYREEQERRREGEQRRQVAESLRDILAVLNSSRPLAEILDYIVDQACRLLGSDGGLICSLQDNGMSLQMQCARGLGPEYTPDVTIPVGHGVIGWAVQKRQPVTVPDVAAALADDKTIPDVRGRPLRVGGHIRHRAMLAVPLHLKDEVYGGITLYYTEPREFSPEEIELAAIFANQAALAIENARLRGQAEQSAVAAERSRLARDLHDAVTQTLFSASLIAEVLPRLWERSPDEARRRLEELRQLTRGALAEMRTLLLELRPAALMEVALGDLLRQLAEAVTGRARIPVSVDTEGECQLAPEVQIALYRIAQEALNNVAKHSAASSASVSLRCQPGRVELRVSDDGRGLDLATVPSGHLGLGIMNERADSIGATLSIASKPGEGTQISVVWRESESTSA